MRKIRDRANCYTLGTFLISFSIIIANDIGFNGAVDARYGNSYNFYNFSENLLDLNFFYNDVQGWIQYEYSNPPDIGFSTNDIRKFRLEYVADDFLIKLGDIYQFWGRGLVLNQFDDQVTHFDNGVRGLYLEYNKYPFSFSHLNGNSDIWMLGGGARIPENNNIHNMSANRINYDLSALSLGFTQLETNEKHSLNAGPPVDINHNILGSYLSWAGNFTDIFLEYADKVSTMSVSTIGGTPNDTLKKGYGYYQNINLYFGNWGLTTEYKRYSFDRLHGELTANEYGNQIEYQQMPTLAREHNSTLLGRVSHTHSFNDERGVQFELNGSIMDLAISMQYAHLSRNEKWQSNSHNEWTYEKIDGYLPSSDFSTLPYWENYNEVNGYVLNDRLYFKIGLGRNREIINNIRNYVGMQKDLSNVDTSYIEVYDSLEWDGTWYYDTTLVPFYDSLFTDEYDVESKLWQQAESFTIPIELNYIFESGYSIGLGFQYQERKKFNRMKGNATNYDYGKSKWTMYDPDDYSQSFSTTTTQFASDNGPVNKQYNRLIYFSVSKASKWSLTITHDATNAFETGQLNDPYYNPLEALIYGDIKYFIGDRKNTNAPKWAQNRWVSAEFAYNITSSQRVSIMYGSIQGGLFCSNGICRIIPPFNDGVKVSYSASF
ncbi:MAG: DUF6029 family protein [Candidatus Neomarinimicrobiota bacterium]